MIHLILKKTTILTSLLLSLALILGACGDKDKDDATKDVTNNDTSNDIEETAPGEDPAATGESFGFKKFELEVDYPDQDEAIDVNYEEEKDATDAEYKNVDDDNSDVTGQAAMAKLKPLLESLQLNEDMTDEEIMERIVTVFNINDNYTKIDIDITWENGEEKEIEDVK